jgi:hypothetical protein
MIPHDSQHILASAAAAESIGCVGKAVLVHCAGKQHAHARY